MKLNKKSKFVNHAFSQNKGMELFIVFLFIILFLCGILLLVTFAFMLMVNVLAAKFNFPGFSYWDSLLVIIGLFALASLLRFKLRVKQT